MDLVARHHAAFSTDCLQGPRRYAPPRGLCRSETRLTPVPARPVSHRHRRRKDH
jgi:hypothetical protein